MGQRIMICGLTFIERCLLHGPKLDCVSQETVRGEREMIWGVFMGFYIWDPLLLPAPDDLPISCSASLHFYIYSKCPQLFFTSYWMCCGLNLFCQSARNRKRSVIGLQRRTEIEVVITVLANSY